MSMTQASLTAKWKALTLTEIYRLHQASTEIQGEFSRLQLWRVLLGLNSSSPALTASRSPLALKDMKCCSVWDISFWTCLFRCIPVPWWEQTSKPCCGLYYERNLCKKLGGPAAHQLYFSSICSGMLSSDDSLEMLLQGARHLLPFCIFFSRHAQQRYLSFACLPTRENFISWIHPPHFVH